MNLGELMTLVTNAKYVASRSYEHGLGGEHDYAPDLEKFRKLSDEDLRRLLDELHDLVKGVCELENTSL